jgi:signal transduction histidine kinase
MQELINDVLEFSKISVDKKSFKDIDMERLLKELITELGPAIREKNACAVLETIPVLHVNASLMRQLFSNLISNALKYGNRTGETVIRIYSEAGAVNNGHPTRFCRIIVEDNGIGFDQKYAEEIFEMFRRLHPKTEYEGTGIGLALCKKIVEKHNGFISARGKPGEGASFIVSLPFI